MNETRRSFLAMVAHLPGMALLSSWLARPIEAKNACPELSAGEMQALKGVKLYRGIVRQIGGLFGVEARTSDDGSVQADVLALKVPGLVERYAIRWIPVKERSPVGPSRGVLVFRVPRNSYEESIFSICTDGTANPLYGYSTLTHWAELPGPPATKNDA